jgi:ribosome-associated protein
MHTDDEFDTDDFPQRPSKSSLKRESEALRDLGEALIALPRERLNEVPLPAELLEAVGLAQSIAQHHGAYKRQRKYIGKLLRDIDVEPIRARLAGFDRQSAEAIHKQHALERWRDRLLAGDDQDINALMSEHPGADRQKLRQLVRDALKEREGGLAPRSARLLFRYLRELMAEAATTDADRDGRATH